MVERGSDEDAIPDGACGRDALAGVVVDAPPHGPPVGPWARRDQQMAVRDLLETGSFRPHGLDGPFVLHLGFEKNRIAFDVRDRHGALLRRFAVPLGPLRTAIRDYRMIVAAHVGALENGGMARVEALDLARRAVHDEASTILLDALAPEAVLDHPTARRFFTLVYAVVVEP